MVKTGGEILIDALIRSGIEYITGIPGHGCLAIFEALRKRSLEGKIQYIQSKHETCAVHMADGYYRACGKPMAVITSVGAGAMNTMLGMATAYADSTPVIVITGGAHVHMRGTGILQELERQFDDDFTQAARAVSKRCFRVDSIQQLPRVIQRAIGEATRLRRGPVLINIPMDVQASSMEDPQWPKPADIAPVCAPRDKIRCAAQMLREARRPLILAGGGTYYARATSRLIRLAEKLGAPVLTTMASKSVFPEDHPLYGFHGGSKGTAIGNALARSADVVIALGCRFADETTSSYRKGVTYNFPDTKLIHVDIDARELGKNYPCDLAIQADLLTVIDDLLEELSDYQPDEERKKYCAEIAQMRQDWLNSVSTNPRKFATPITISHLLSQLRQELPKDAIIVSSSGNTQAQILQEYVFTVPMTHITTGGFSTMGFAYTAALGAKLALPDRTIVCVCGDGDMSMVMQEMSIAAQYGLSVIAVVADNQGWLAIRDLQMDAFGQGHEFGNDFTYRNGQPFKMDFCMAARAMGIDAYAAKCPSEVSHTLREALSQNRPALIEVSVNRAYPLSGGESLGWWDVPVPGDMPVQRRQYESGKAGETV